MVCAGTTSATGATANRVAGAGAPRVDRTLSHAMVECQAPNAYAQLLTEPNAAPSPAAKNSIQPPLIPRS